ncbi:MAG TPA: hypothetical protein VIS72_07670 [Anaerolineales bacterium]
MKTIVNWMKSHPLAMFFSLALVLTYGLLIGLGLALASVLAFALAGLENQSDLMNLLLINTGRLMVYGPVLAGMIVTRSITPGQKPGSARKRWLTFLIVWITAMVVSTLGLQQESASNIGLIPLVIISIPIALVPAFVFSSAFSKVASLRDYLSTLVHPRGHFVWYLIALLTFPMIHLLGIMITNLLDSNPLLSNVHFNPGILSAPFITFTSVFFYSGGVNEEGRLARFRTAASSSPLQPTGG